MNRRDFLKALGIGAAGTAIVGYEYIDIFGFSKFEMGRTKNSIATVVAGIVGQKMYGNSNIDLQIEKTAWPNARVTGQTTPNSVDTYVNLALTSAHFKAQNNNSGQLEGEVDKSEFDWKVKQIGPNEYHIARFGPKFDSELHLSVENGKISGIYDRTGPHFNWSIQGTYDQAGNVNMGIDGPVTLGIVLNGKITPK